MIVRLTTIETRSATVSDRLSDWKNWPTTPRTKARGTNTRIVVRVEPIDRAADLLARPVHGRVARLALGQVPRDVLDHDHRVVDDQADGDGQAAQRHQVQRVARQVEEHEADDQAQGNGERGDQRRPHALEEQQQDDHAEACRR